MGTLAFQAVWCEYGKDDESSKVEEAAAVEIIGKYRVFCEFCLSCGRVVFLWLPERTG